MFQDKVDFAAMFLVYESFIIPLICISHYVLWPTFLKIEFYIINSEKKLSIVADSGLI